MKITTLVADCDETLTTFEAAPAYEIAEALLREEYPGFPRGAALQLYNRVHAGDAKAAKDVERVFTLCVGHDGCIPKECKWSRYAAFRALIVANAVHCTNFGRRTRERLALAAETRFWNVIAERAERYDDALGLFNAARDVGAVVQPVTSSDVRATLHNDRICYIPEASTDRKRRRIDPLLFTPELQDVVREPFVFERHAKADPNGWRLLLARSTCPDMTNAAIVGDSLGDIAAGVTMGMQVRILLDREGNYSGKPMPSSATHIVRTLNELPAGLGWR